MNVNLPDRRATPAPQGRSLPPALDLYRACTLCSYHRCSEGLRCCQHPDLLAGGLPSPIELVRAWGGGCGPDAGRAQAPWAQH